MEHETFKALERHWHDAVNVERRHREAAERERDLAAEALRRMALDLQSAEARASKAEAEYATLNAAFNRRVILDESMRTERIAHAQRQAALMLPEAMCESHPGREWPHDDCAGPGMPWIVEGREAIEPAFAKAAAIDALEARLRESDRHEALLYKNDLRPTLVAELGNPDTQHTGQGQTLAAAITAALAQAQEKKP